MPKIVLSAIAFHDKTFIGSANAFRKRFRKLTKESYGFRFAFCSSSELMEARKAETFNWKNGRALSDQISDRIGERLVAGNGSSGKRIKWKRIKRSDENESDAVSSVIGPPDCRSNSYWRHYLRQIVLKILIC